MISIVFIDFAVVVSFFIYQSIMQCMHLQIFIFFSHNLSFLNSSYSILNQLSSLKLDACRSLIPGPSYKFRLLQVYEWTRDQQVIADCSTSVSLSCLRVLWSTSYPHSSYTISQSAICKLTDPRSTNKC